MVTVTNIVPDPPQATKRTDPENYVDPHCNTYQRKLDKRQIAKAFQCHIRQKTAAASGTHRTKSKERHGSTKYGYVGHTTLTPSQKMIYNP